MRVTVILVTVLLLAQLCADIYLFFVAWRRMRRIGWAKFQLYESAFFLIYAIVLLCLPARSGESESGFLTLVWMIFGYILVYSAKLTFILFDLIASIPKLLKRKRLKWLTAVGGIGAGAMVITICWGAFVNRFRIQVKEVPVQIESLPSSFSGYKIVQISDLHLGTFGADTTFVSQIVDRINSINPDMVVFTGDLVNQRASEAIPFVKPLKRLSARDGVFSILGNHDYGDYVRWHSEIEKEENLEQLMDLQIAMGWDLLTNSSETIYGNEACDSLILIGVENWGDPPFPQYGNLEAAYPTPADSVAKILLTHNPRHWTDIIEPSDSLNIALTLSGHTHAMQIQIGSFSPAAWRYPNCWGGLYNSSDGRQLLYVNIGAGTVGFPIRIGATPEITVFTLYPKR